MSTPQIKVVDRSEKSANIVGYRGQADVPKQREVSVAFFGLWNKNNEAKQLTATIPLTYDLNSAVYPEGNYDNFAKEGYAKNEIVYACIKELATSTANPRYMLQVPSAEGGNIEIERGDLWQLMQTPTASLDWYQWIEMLVTHLMVSGNAYVLKERARTTSITGLPLLRPDRVTINMGSNGADSYTYDIGGKEYRIPAEDMAHLSLPNPTGDAYGLSPLQVLSRSINLDLNMTDYAKVFFQNAGVPSGLLKIKRRLQSQEEAQVIRSRWRSQFGGTSNFHRVAIMDDDAEYQPMGGVPKDLALHELHNFAEARICAVFGVPPILIGCNVGLERSTYSNYREARVSFNQETLRPMVTRITRFLNRNIASEFSNQGEFAVDESSLNEMIDDKESNVSRAVLLFEKGLITLNESRAMIGEEAMSDGDVRRVPSGLMEMPEGGLILEPVEPEAIAPPEEPAPIETEGTQIEAYKSPLVARAFKLRRLLLLDREDLIERETREFNKYYKRIKNRADGVLGRLLERSGDVEITKALPIIPAELVTDIEEQYLTEIMYRAYLKATKQTFISVNGSGVAGTLDWSEKLPIVTGILTQAPTRAKMIHSTTRKVVQKVLSKALERGYSIEQVVRGVPKDNFAGMSATLGNTEQRARLTARTEMMRTQNLTSVGFFKQQGFDYVQATDPDGDPNDTYVDVGDPYGRTCIERDGKIYRVEDANNIQDHPNGTLSWMPVSRDYQPTEAV